MLGRRAGKYGMIMECNKLYYQQFTIYSDRSLSAMYCVCVCAGYEQTLTTTDLYKYEWVARKVCTTHKRRRLMVMND